jgi:hypothetical protein
VVTDNSAREYHIAELWEFGGTFREIVSPRDDFWLRESMRHGVVAKRYCRVVEVSIRIARCEVAYRANEVMVEEGEGVYAAPHMIGEHSLEEPSGEKVEAGERIELGEGGGSNFPQSIATTFRSGEYDYPCIRVFDQSDVFHSFRSCREGRERQEVMPSVEYGTEGRAVRRAGENFNASKDELTVQKCPERIFKFKNWIIERSPYRRSISRGLLFKKPHN